MGRTIAQCIPLVVSAHDALISTAYGPLSTIYRLQLGSIFRGLSTSACFSTAQPLTAQATPTAAATREALANGGISKVLVANRGEIACRVMATAKRLGLRTVAVYSEADRRAQHVQMADEAYCIGGAAARDSYLRGEVVLQVARQAGAQAVHPGYGFLSENAAFSQACQAAGIAFIGPPASAIRSMGDKAAAKAIMSGAGVPVVPGYHGEDQEEKRLLDEAQRIGFPLLVKAVSGGGGKGMKLAHSMQELPEALASARREAASSFGDDRVLLERYVTRPRHVEVQIVADSHGDAVYLFDRDCSLQRRHQKIIEEAPAPGLPGQFHAMIGEAAVRAAQAVGYVNAGTVEFIVDVDSPGSKDFYFMEMNTRLQVEHPVSEAVAGVDLVEWQLGVAAGGKLPLTQQQVFHGEQVLGAGPLGHSFEARLYAESPRNNFLPGAGTVARWRPPPGCVSFQVPNVAASVSGSGASSSTAELQPYVRVDSGVREGDTVGTNYDPMIAKIITWGPDRASALAALQKALAETQVAGLPTNLPYLRRLAAHPAFAACELDTGFVGRHAAQLLAPQHVFPRAAALAAVARHLLQVRAAATVRPAGAWGVPDSKRLWHTPTFTFNDMGCPEAGLPSKAAAALSAAETATSGSHTSHSAHTAAGRADHTHHTQQHSEQGLSVDLTVASAHDFECVVHGLQDSTPHSTHSMPHSAQHAAGGHRPSHKEGGSSAGGGLRVAVRGVKLSDDGGRLEAEVEGCRVVADVAQLSVGSSGEQGLYLWMEEPTTDGAGSSDAGAGITAYEFRWAPSKWSKDPAAAGHASR